MKEFFKKNWQTLCIYIIPLIMFFPSLFKFYTNDDFFFLKIANVSSLKAFLDFFNLAKDTGNIGVYRPLTLRVFYFLGDKLFNLNPIPLHVISFITFFAVIFLVGKLVRLLTNDNKIALLSSFLYAVSVTHFGQLYYVGAFQEICLTLLFLASVIFFIDYELEIKSKHSIYKLVMCFLFFILAVMSKETAVVLPVILILVHYYLKLTKRVKVSVKTLFFSLLPFAVVFGIYMFLHFRYFGVITGDSYVWDFAPFRALNTLSWYGLWSLNLPETLIDFVGPGLHLNPNLFKYWSGEIIPIFILFGLQILMIFYLLVRFIKIGKKNLSEKLFLPVFSISWFVVTLAPILFLPVHKFTYYLTLPLIGVTLILGYLINEAKIKSIGTIFFLVIWLATSIFTLHLTLETNWIIQGEDVSERAYLFFSQNKFASAIKNIDFIDTEADATLPWSPTATLKVVLSDKSFFDVFYPNLSAKINYIGLTKVTKSSDTQVINSRQFLGY